MGASEAVSLPPPFLIGKHSILSLVETIPGSVPWKVGCHCVGNILLNLFPYYRCIMMTVTLSSVCLPAVVFLLDIRVTKRENKGTGNKGVIIRLGVEYRWRTVIIGIDVRRSEVLWLNSFFFFISVTAD